MNGMTKSLQGASVEEQQQEEGEVHEEEEKDKGTQDDAHAEIGSHQEDGIATNIKVKEVSSQHSSVHANNPCLPVVHAHSVKCPI